jgi:hypothetical protein
MGSYLSLRFKEKSPQPLRRLRDIGTLRRLPRCKPLGMDQKTAIQAFIDRHQSSSFVKSLLETYLQTPDGRSKIAHSMIHPARLVVESLQDRSRIPELDTLEGYKTFLAAVPNEEKSRDPYPELQGYVDVIEASLKPPA